MCRPKDGVHAIQVRRWAQQDAEAGGATGRVICQRSNCQILSSRTRFSGVSHTASCHGQDASPVVLQARLDLQRHVLAGLCLQCAEHQALCCARAAAAPPASVIMMLRRQARQRHWNTSGDHHCELEEACGGHAICCRFSGSGRLRTSSV